jgi:CHAT domain-containing protein
MEEHSWVHLACHASQNASFPTASAFHLHGGALELAEIMSKSPKSGGFAFLSACETAAGDERLPDEAVHLAAGMVMAGYTSVIATMWSIKDEDAPLVAERIYAHMLAAGSPDARRASKSLHDAIRCLRDKVGERDFARWVPYIHIGV